MADHGKGKFGVEVTWKMMTRGNREKDNYWYETEKERDGKLKSFSSSGKVHVARRIGR